MVALTGPIEALLLDLDNTLYPPSSGLLEAGDVLITAFIADRLGIARREADKLRVRLWREYGATARGLQVEYGVPHAEMYRASIERLSVEKYLRPDPALAAMLTSLGVDSYVFTNSTATYAQRVLAALGVCEAIEGIFDIEFARGMPKPQAQPYERVLATLGRPASSVALVEDTEANLEPAAELGMVTIKLGETPAADRHLHLPVLAGLRDLLRDI